jgi:hypothetical protein
VRMKFAQTSKLCGMSVENQQLFTENMFKGIRKVIASTSDSLSAKKATGADFFNLADNF